MHYDSDRSNQQQITSTPRALILSGSCSGVLGVFIWEIRMEKRMDDVTVSNEGDTVVMTQVMIGQYDSNIALNPEQIPLLIEWLIEAQKAAIKHKEEDCGPTA